MFYLIQYIQAIITSKYNPYKKFVYEIFYFLRKSKCILYYKAQLCSD